jgi:hypothetical protein
VNLKVAAIVMVILLLGSGVVVAGSTFSGNLVDFIATLNPANLTAQNVNENNGEGGDSPPDWAAEKARERYEWSQSGEEGPPPWAPEHAREHYDWSQSGEEGPPPWANAKAGERDEEDKGGPPSWAPEHAREHYEWAQSGQQGPPPWANGKPKVKGNGR